MRTFVVVWAGQIVSTLGTGLTFFGLSIWVFTESGSVTQLATVLLASQLPQILLAPFVGVIVDRWDRRLVMIFADAGAGAATVAIALLFFTDSVALWNLVLVLVVAGIFQAFQYPAYSAATTLLVPKRHLGRAAGMVQLGSAIGNIASPFLAGIILVTGGIEMLIAIDVVTFLFAVATLLVVRFPQPEQSAAGARARGSMIDEAKYGFRYIWRRHGLFALLLYFAAINLVFAFVSPLGVPLVLSFASEAAVGVVFSLASIGMLVGSVVASTWGGPKRRVRGLLLMGGFLGFALAGVGLRPSVVTVVVFIWLAFLVVPTANATSQALWQTKVEPDVQGRVFAVRGMVGQAAVPLAYLLVGPLADGVFEPLMSEDGLLADSVGSIIGTGPGRGIGFFIVVVGILAMIASLIAWTYRPLRNLERDIPDAIGTSGYGDDVIEDPAAGEPVAEQTTTSGG